MEKLFFGLQSLLGLPAFLFPSFIFVNHMFLGGKVEKRPVPRFLALVYGMFFLFPDPKSHVCVIIIEKNRANFRETAG